MEISPSTCRSARVLPCGSTRKPDGKGNVTGCGEGNGEGKIDCNRCVTKGIAPRMEQGRY